jgi:hypothetical protein
MGKRKYKNKVQIVQNQIENEQPTKDNNWWMDKYK